jgi:hypothetical protein
MKARSEEARNGQRATILVLEKSDQVDHLLKYN